jgi:hypothetical protein
MLVIYAHTQGPHYAAMDGTVVLLIFVGDVLKSRRSLEAENLFLRHQLSAACMLT